MLVCVSAALAPVIPAAERASLRGKLGADEQGRPRLLAAAGEAVRLEGDVETMGVLTDARLLGSDFEVLGQRLSRGLFRVDRIHTTALFVHREGRKYLVTYWCDVCFIRTYTPSKCACCQKETDLDLRDPDEK